VSIALDQRAVDEQVAITNSYRYLDSFLAGFFRGSGEDAAPIITNEKERCEVSIARPKTIPGVCTTIISRVYTRDWYPD
jgi:hypothetical protein